MQVPIFIAEPLAPPLGWGLFGAQGETRTPTLANWYLKPACLPIPPPGQIWSLQSESNQRPTDYKSVALPAEL
jgi:hypothetical protein